MKSLQEISATKTLKVLRNDENAIDTLFGFTDEQRQVLLPYLRQEYLRLLAIEKDHEAAQQRIPAADRHICFRDKAEDDVVKEPDGERARNDGNDEEQMHGGYESDDDELDTDDETASEDDDVEQFVSGPLVACRRQHDFQTKWRFGSVEHLPKFLGFDPSKWRKQSHHILVITPGQAKPVKTCFDVGNIDGEWSYYNSTELSSLISSQLLYYRLTAAFGMPPPMPQQTSRNRAESCWRVDMTPWHRASQLTFLDHVEGGASRIPWICERHGAFSRTTELASQRSSATRSQVSCSAGRETIGLGRAVPLDKAYRD